MEVFDALKNQTVDLVLTAHPTQSVRKSTTTKPFSQEVTASKAWQDKKLSNSSLRKGHYSR
uniref:Phosphoenolpyruvate carboxylase n=1 Tax=Arundo donax TaxID=35708 RepID=A0A0A9EM59_ARUDO